MNKLTTIIAFTVLLPACKLLEQPFGPSDDAHSVADAILAHAPAIADNAGTITALFTGNPALGAAIATILTGLAGVATAKKIKKIKAAKSGN